MTRKMMMMKISIFEEMKSLSWQETRMKMKGWS